MAPVALRSEGSLSAFAALAGSLGGLLELARGFEEVFDVFLRLGPGGNDVRPPPMRCAPPMDMGPAPAECCLCIACRLSKERKVPPPPLPEGDRSRALFQGSAAPVPSSVRMRIIVAGEGVRPLDVVAVVELRKKPSGTSRTAGRAARMLPEGRRIGELISPERCTKASTLPDGRWPPRWVGECCVGSAAAK